MSWFARRRRTVPHSRPEVRVLINTNVSMSRHKAAAQAVHAALAVFGIEHGVDLPIARTIEGVVSGKIRAADAYRGLTRAVPAGHESDPG